MPNTYIPIKHIVIRDDNGNLSIDAADIDEAVTELNAEFNPLGIYFVECGPKEYYNYSTYTNDLNSSLLET